MDGLGREEDEAGMTLGLVVEGIVGVGSTLGGTAIGGTLGGGLGGTLGGETGGVEEGGMEGVGDDMTVESDVDCVDWVLELESVGLDEGFGMDDGAAGGSVGGVLVVARLRRVAICSIAFVVASPA